jgi:hypothetical protein
VEGDASPTKLPMVLALTVAVLTVAWATSAAAQSHPPSDSAAFVVKIDETTIDHTKLVTSSDCIRVLPDGRFHLERRKQALPNPTSSLDISESSLDSTQLQRLHNILEGEDINKLPEYVLPVFPITAPWFGSFRTKISRGGQVRTVGYWLWQGGTPRASPNSTPDNIKEIWKESEVALRPLVEWFHGIEALKLSPSGAQSTQCDNVD